jgi:predicted nucleic acid-binding protein
MKFIDANVIAHSFYPSKKQEPCKQIVRIGGITNTIAIIEAFNIIEHQVDRDHARDMIRSLYGTYVEIVDVDKNLIFEALRKSKKETKLKFIDLVHYTTALLHNCDGILTYDKDFDCLDIPRDEP